MNEKPRNIFIGNALPYANGSLHIGHLAALIGGDVLARYYRLCGDSVVFVSGSDCYGTPIAVEALAQGVEPNDIVEKYHREFKDLFLNTLSFSFDYFTQTTDPKHNKLVQEIFIELYEKRYIYTKIEKNLYSPELERFLPDRFVEGECHHCGFDGARGDQCDECGKLIDATKLIKPRVNKKTVPIGKEIKGDIELRDTEHFYLKLSAFQKQLEELVEKKGDGWRNNASHFTKGLLKQGLKDRAITRDTEWGVPIPLEGYESKRIYVWFEAVLAYLSATMMARENSWKDWWLNKDAIQYYVQGKDNVVFHTIILPAILIGTEKGYNLVDYLFSSELVMLEGAQFSKSRDHAIYIKDIGDKNDIDLVRYYLLSHGPEHSDTNFSWSEFNNVVNGELVDKVSNLVHRVCSIVEKNFKEGVETSRVENRIKEQTKELEKTFKKVGEDIEKGMFARASKTILEVAEIGNQQVHNAEPWKKLKEDEEGAKDDLAVFLHRIYSLGVLLQPFIPQTSYRLQKLFGEVGIKSEESNGNQWVVPEMKSIYRVREVEPLLTKRI